MILEIKTGPVWWVIIPSATLMIFGFIGMTIDRLKYMRKQKEVNSALYDQKYDPGDFKRQESDSDQQLFT